MGKPLRQGKPLNTSGGACMDKPIQITIDGDGDETVEKPWRSLKNAENDHTNIEPDESLEGDYFFHKTFFGA